ncbi:MAG: OmpA family protein [Prevotellaceae bacterium]|jgi:outer membrane protein OmpA-like peptidoglycan-associated protein|nr:OmpA family protein [Prevotellaceae bacterium]
MKAALVLLLLVVVAGSVSAARPRHYLGGWVYTGYSAMLHQMYSTSTLGGIGTGFGGGYQLKKDNFLLNAGLEFTFLNSATRVESLDGSVPMQDTQGKDLEYFYTFHSYKDRQHAGYLHVPVLAGMQIDRYYFLAGVKAGLPLFATYGGTARLSTYGIYEQYIDPFDPIYLNNHYFIDDVKLKDKGASSLNLNVAASVEFGVELNKFIKNKAFRKNKNQPRLRAAVFADYGLLNINGFAPSSARPLDQEAPVRPSITEKDKVGISTVSLLAAGRAEDVNVNPLLVGVKGTVFIDITKPPKKKPAPKPQPKPRPPAPKPQPKPVIPVITGKIINAETQEVVYDARVEIRDVTGKQKPYSAQPGNGIFNTKLPRDGKYHVTVNVPGYMAYTDSVSNVGDTLTLYLHPIRKGEVFILRNVFFDFDQTTIQPQSNPALDELARFLEDNYDVHIQITGHTDNKGSATYNQRLSEGRAKAVYEALIARGIDADRLSYLGAGSNDPITTNDTEENRAMNRRVEFKILDTK